MIPVLSLAASPSVVFRLAAAIEFRPGQPIPFIDLQQEVMRQKLKELKAAKRWYQIQDH